MGVLIDMSYDMDPKLQEFSIVKLQTKCFIL